MKPAEEKQRGAPSMTLFHRGMGGTPSAPSMTQLHRGMGGKHEPIRSTAIQSDADALIHVSMLVILRRLPQNELSY